MGTWIYIQQESLHQSCLYQSSLHQMSIHQIGLYQNPLQQRFLPQNYQNFVHQFCPHKTLNRLCLHSLQQAPIQKVPLSQCLHQAKGSRGSLPFHIPRRSRPPSRQDYSNAPKAEKNIDTEPPKHAGGPGSRVPPQQPSPAHDLILGDRPVGVWR